MHAASVLKLVNLNIMEQSHSFPACIPALDCSKEAALCPVSRAVASTMEKHGKTLT